MATGVYSECMHKESYAPSCVGRDEKLMELLVVR